MFNYTSSPVPRIKPAIVGWPAALIQFVVDLLKTLVGICGDAHGFFGWLLEAVRKLKKGDCSGVEGLVSKLVDIIGRVALFKIEEPSVPLASPVYLLRHQCDFISSGRSGCA
ncbi:MAG: hypothetical protein R3C18_10515 [Planctomycetaceae bacterium]